MLTALALFTSGAHAAPPPTFDLPTVGDHQQFSGDLRLAGTDMDGATWTDVAADFVPIQRLNLGVSYSQTGPDMTAITHPVDQVLVSRASLDLVNQPTAHFGPWLMTRYSLADRATVPSVGLALQGGVGAWRADLSIPINLMDPEIPLFTPEATEAGVTWLAHPAHHVRVGYAPAMGPHLGYRLQHATGIHAGLTLSHELMGGQNAARVQVGLAF